METHSRLLVIAVVVVVAGVAGAAAFGVGPFPSDSLPNGGTTTEAPDDDPSSAGGGGGSGGGGDSGTATATPEPSPFGFTIDSIENCGNTCRDVTATLTNRQDGAVSDVDVTTRIYVKEDKIWQGSEDVGRLAAGESSTTTKRVEIGYFDAAKIKNNDGYITVETTVQSSAGTYTFSGRRQVA
jgi:hypothetical protein